jgi:primosomal protein N' (replication factor Y) (superfamily II helicase)
VFEVTERPVSRFDSKLNSAVSGDIVLSGHQEEGLQQIQQQFEKHNVVLLHGVTSGGKTEIYIKLIEETLQKGKRVLYLLPEIALTTHIISRLRKYFGNEIGVYHSKYNSDERAEVWDNIANREEHKIHPPFKIILGPRSAIFLPFDNLGLIIIDEEHDQSYKQFDPAPRYNARDAAIYLATLHEAKVLLGSATPSLESYFNAQRGKYGLVMLTERYGGVEMPKIEVVDMRDEMRRRLLQSHFSSVLMNGIKEALEKKQQVILFQNRRGFSLRIECEQCNWVPQCKNCDVTLTYHKNSDLLKCHYCGYSTTVPPSCSNCGSPNLKMIGFGTEKVAEELGILLPEAKIDRMDLDSTRSKNAFQKIFSDFENQKTDILTGTQMVTKGLDFDNVQVVGILNADNMLSFPDFRAHERSYQLMSQVSGRAGRKEKQGNVVIQAWQPNHPIIRQVVETDFENMAETQLAEREKFHYPPFYRLINIKMKHKNAELLFDASVFLGKEFRARFGNRVLGPEYPLVSRIRNLYIRQIMIKNPANSSQAELKERVFEVIDMFRKVAKYKSVIIQFDVDPQ